MKVHVPASWRGDGSRRVDFTIAMQRQSVWGGGGGGGGETIDSVENNYLKTSRMVYTVNKSI